MKWTAAIVSSAIVAGLAIAVVAHPTSTLHRVVVVFDVWLIAMVVNWFGLMAMAAASGLKKIRYRDATTRQAVALGMNHRTFWVGFWVSLVAGVINTLAPLGLIGSIPSWSVAVVFLANALLSAPAVPLRVWLWGIHNERVGASS